MKIALIVAAGAFVIGYFVASGRDGSPAPVAAGDSATGASARAASTPVRQAHAVRHRKPARRRARRHVARHARPVVGVAAVPQRFWQVIGQTRATAGVDSGAQTELLTERLKHWSPPAILRFYRLRRSLDRRAYTWNLWAAAYVIEDGCSDDCFRDFRGYLISLGRGPYERALRNPDSLAGIVQDAETGDWESASDPAAEAYTSVTGRDFPYDNSDLSGQPRGRPFDENNVSALERRFPRLAASFR